MPECPECRDQSRYATDAYKPFCRITQNSVPREKFELYCKSYRNYRECDAYKKKYR